MSTRKPVSLRDKVEKLREFVGGEHVKPTLQRARSVFRRGADFTDDLSEYLLQLSVCLDLCVEMLAPEVNETIDASIYANDSTDRPEETFAPLTDEEELELSEYEGTKEQLLLLRRRYKGKVPPEIMCWFVSDASSTLEMIEESLSGARKADWQLELVAKRNKRPGNRGYPRDYEMRALVRAAYMKILDSHNGDKNDAEDEMNKLFNIHGKVIQDSIAGPIFPGIVKYQSSVPDRFARKLLVSKTVDKLLRKQSSADWPREEIEARVARLLPVEDREKACIMFEEKRAARKTRVLDAVRELRKKTTSSRWSRVKFDEEITILLRPEDHEQAWIEFERSRERRN